MFDPIIELHMKLQRNRQEAQAAREYNNDLPSTSLGWLQ